MIDMVIKIASAAEEITDEVTHSAGMIVTKATPLLAPVASGLTVLFAVYDGVGKMLDGKIEHAYTWSLVAGLLLMFSIEGINFAATFGRDRTERLRPKHKDALENVNGDGVALGAFWLTVAAVFCLETLPGIVSWYHGQMSVGDATFRTGLLILPVFSKIGAKIFSLSALLDSLEGTQEARRMRRLQEKKAAAELDIDLEMKRLQMAQDLELKAAEHAQKLELRRNQATGKIGKNDEISDFSTISPDDKQDALARMRHRQKKKIDARRQTILDALADNEFTVSDLASRVGCSQKTIKTDLEALQAAGRSMSINGTVKLI